MFVTITKEFGRKRILKIQVLCKTKPLKLVS